MIPLNDILPKYCFWKKIFALCIFVAVCNSSLVYGGDILGSDGLSDFHAIVKDAGAKEVSERLLPDVLSREETFQQFEEFTVPLQEGLKKGRILVCTLVIEPNQGVIFPEDKASMRKIIYGILKGQKDISQSRRRLKEDIKAGLNAFMGGQGVKDIYFTKFILL